MVSVDVIFVLQEYLGQQSVLGQVQRRRFALVRLELVEFRQVVVAVMALDLLFVHDATGQRQFRHLTIVDLLLHRAGGEETVNVARLLLSESTQSDTAARNVRMLRKNEKADFSRDDKYGITKNKKAVIIIFIFRSNED